MKVLQANTYDLQGGAAKFAMRLNKELNNRGFSSEFLVQNSSGLYNDIICGANSFQKDINGALSKIEKIPLLLYPNRRDNLFSSAIFRNNSAGIINRIEADIVNLHWVNDGFLSLNAISGIKSPIIWTMHDSWVFTGGCHIPYDCEGYKNNCRECRHLGGENALSSWNFKRKADLYKSKKISFISPSIWLYNKALESELLIDAEIRHIPNGVDHNIYKPMDKAELKKRFNLDPKKKAVLIGSSLKLLQDKNKGFHISVKLMETLGKQRDDIEAVIVGPAENVFPNNSPVKVHAAGKITEDKKMAELYNAADVFVLPSLSENFSTMALESIACGIPVVCFNIGGNPEIVEHKKNGYLAVPFEVSDLANGVNETLSSSYRQYSENARNKVLEKFTWDEIIPQYINAYESKRK